MSPDTKVLFLALATPPAVVVCLATFAGLVDFAEHARGKKGSDGISRLYVVGILFILVLLLLPIVGDVFDQLSDGDIIGIVFGSSFGLLPLAILLTSKRNRRLLERIQVAGWICGALLVCIAAVRFLLKSPY